MKLGIMQGRLLRPETNHIQCFPKKNWEKEFSLANLNKIKIIEWIVDREGILKNPINTNQGRIKINKLKKKYNIKINSLTADFFLQKPFTDKKNNQNYEFNLLKKTLKNAAKINIKYFVIPILEKASLKKKDENFFIGKFKTLSKILKKNNQVILFETDLDILRIQNIFKNLPKRNFGINFDTGNSIDCNYSFDDIKTILKFTYNIHLKDKDKNLKTIKLGKGLFDFKKFFKLLKKNNYKKNLILQTARSTTDDVKNILINKKFVDNLL